MISFFEDFFRIWCCGSWFVLVLWFIIAGLIIFVIAMIVDEVKTSMAIGIFFDKYEPDSGVIYDYAFVKASDTTIITPICVGSTTIMNTRHYPHSNKYFIRIECRNKGKHFLLRYQISKAEYKKDKIGSVVEIQSDWIRYGFCILD